MRRASLAVSVLVCVWMAQAWPRTATADDTPLFWDVAFADTTRLHLGDSPASWPGPATLWEGYSLGAGDVKRERESAIQSGSSPPVNLPGSVPGLEADPTLWGADGDVLGMARSGNTLYLAGAFRSIGENSGGLVPTDPVTGDVLRSLPKVAGQVRAIVSDGRGGWFLGGNFTSVGGKPREGLAQIQADGSVSEWNPKVTGSPGYLRPPTVTAMSVLGKRVYVAGGFLAIGGKARSNLGCVDASSGAVLDWDPRAPINGGTTVLASNDSTIFVGGYFFEIGGQPRNHLAAIDARTGAVKPWRADATGAVLSLLLREDTLFVGGEFGQIGGVTRQHLAAVDIRTGLLLPFNANVRGVYIVNLPWPSVSALTMSGDTLYAGGNFTEIGWRARSTVAALNPTTGYAHAWDPPSFGPVYTGYGPPPCYKIAVIGESVYLGGGWLEAGGVSRPFAAAIRRDTGELTDWNPRANDAVRAIASIGGAVTVGGWFTLVGEWKHRAGLAAIDLTTGRLKPWNPNPDGGVCTAIAVKGDQVFVSGGFGIIGGDPQSRNRIAALDTLNGEVTSWNPGANSNASAFLLVGDTLYAGGYFTQMAGETRNYLAAFDTQTGALTSWNPNADWPVRALARGGGTIYAGGLFTHVGGYRREGVAAIDRLTGAVSPRFNSYTTGGGYVTALAAAGDRLYVGGGFNELGRQPRNALAALDTATGNATSWNPDLLNWTTVHPSVRSLAMRDSTLIVGGSFAAIAGEPRIGLAELDTSTALATAWDPETNGIVWSLLVSERSVYAGGGFTRAGGQPAVGLVAFSPPLPPEPPPPTPQPRPARLQIAGLWPNPARSSVAIRLALPTPARVELDVLDLSGRRVAWVLAGQAIEAGTRELTFSTEGWPVGVYFCRLRNGVETDTRRILVVR